MDEQIENEVIEQPVETVEQPAETPLLRVNSLFKSFGRKEVVRGIDFSMKTGEILGLLGPNCS